MKPAVTAPYIRIRQYVVRMAATARDEPLPILSEHRLSAMFNVCRTTVRKALKEMIAEGRLIVRPGVGMFAVPPGNESPDDFHSGLRRAMVGILCGTGRLVHQGFQYARLQKGVLDMLGETPHTYNGLSLINSDPAKILAEITALRLDGLIWLFPDESIWPVIPRLERMMPVVSVIMRPMTARYLVECSDHYERGERIVEYFAARGCRRFAVLDKPENEFWYCARLFDGLRAACRRRKRVFDEKMLLTDDGRLEQLEAILKFKVDVDGIFSSPRYIERVLEIVRRYAPDMPVLTEECPLNVFNEPPPPRLWFPYEAAGRKAAQLLLNVMNSEVKRPANIKLPGKII